MLRSVRQTSFLVLVAIISIASPGLAQQARTLEPGPARSVGMDESKVQAAVKLYRDALQKENIRGAVLLVARHGKIVVHEAMGWKNYAYKLPMEKDTIFQMASTTKPITATAILMLEEEGKLRTSDAVAKYFESFQNDKAKAITIHHLLSASSGFRIGPIFYPFEKDETPSLRKAVDKFGKDGAAVEPGISFSYSNAGFNTLAALVEDRSGKPLEEFFSERIYKPLGMVDTTNHDDPTKLARMATHYGARMNAEGHVEFSRGYTPGDPPEYPVVRGSGGLITTALDYAKFLQMYLDEGRFSGGRILSPQSVKRATTPNIKVAACPEAAKPCNTLTPFGIPEGSYAMGWFVSDQGVFSHLGGGANNGRYVWADPGRDLLGVVLTTGGNDPRRDFQKLLEEACTSSDRSELRKNGLAR